MTKKDRQIIFDKYAGKCAYTGKPLLDEWEVDHITSKSMYEKIKVSDSYFKHKISGEKITKDQYASLPSFEEMSNYKHIGAVFKPHESCNDISNLVPAIKIINHYKRGHDLEGFRQYMLSFHLRLKKLPKKTMVDRTKRRIQYMMKVAELFDITVDNPFQGKFYFEQITM